MRRVTTTLAALVTMVLLGLIVGAMGGAPATADDQADDRAGDTAEKQKGISVGLRPATKSGGDTSRSVLEYEIPPRGRVVDYVAVSNLRDTPITVRLFTKDATTTTDTPYAVQESSEAPRDVGSWMSLKKDKLTLPPRSETVVPFQVGVPHNAAPGDHTGAIVVSLLAKEPKPDGGTIVVDHRVGLRLLLRVPGDYEPALTVTDVKASWHGPGSVLGRAATVVTYTVRNTGNLRVSATGGLELTRTLGLPSVGTDTEPIAEIQPGGEVQVRQVVPGVLGAGPMKAHVRLHPTPIDPKLEEVPVKDVTASAPFSAWPWLLAAAVAAALLAVSAATWFGRTIRRSRKAAMAPTGGKYRAPVAPDARPDGTDVLVRAAVAVFGGLLVALAAGLFTPAGADDDAVWQGKPSIRQGTDNTPFDVVTTGGCPLPGTNVVGFAHGSGFPKEGGAVIGNGDAGVESRGPFQMPLVSSMQQLMAMQPDPAPLSGVYRIELRCVTPSLEQTTGKYVFEINFTDPHHWRAMPPVTKAQGPNATGADQPDAPSDPSDDSRGGTSGPPATSGARGSGATPSQAEQEAAAQRAAELAGVETTDGEDDQDGTNWPLVGGGIVVLALTGSHLFRRSRT